MGIPGHGHLLRRDQLVGELTSMTCAEIADFMKEMPRLSQRAMHCCPDVLGYLRLISEPLPRDPYDFYSSGVIGDLSGIPIIIEPDFEWGKWELREDGETVTSGNLW